jgi:hypothetical protein
MNKILKISGLILAGFLIILILLPFLFKGRITNLIKEEINKNLKVRVEFSGVGISFLRSFPDMSLSLRDLIVEGIEEFERDTLVSMKTFRMTLDLKSLIKGEDISVKSMFLDKPWVKAKVLPDGLANWDIMIETDEEEDVTDSVDSELVVKLEKFVISDGRVIYEDQSLDFYMLLDQLDGNMRGDLTLDVTTLEVEARAGIFDADYEGFRYVSKASLDVKTLLDFELDRLKFTFRDGVATLNDLTLGIDGWFEMPESDIHMDLTFQSEKSDFKTFLSLVPAMYTEDFSSLTSSGFLSLEGFARGTYGDITLPSVGLNLLVEDGMFRYPELPSSVDQVNISMRVFYDGVDEDKTSLDIEKLSFVMAGNPFSFLLSLRYPFSVQSVKGKAAGKIDFASILEVIPMDGLELKGVLTSDISFEGNLEDLENERYNLFNAFGDFSLSGFEFVSKSSPRKLIIHEAMLSLSPKFADLSAFDMIIGQSDLQMKGRLENLLPYVLSDKTLEGKLEMRSSLLHLNELMTDGQEETAADTLPITIIEIPRNIDFTLSSSIGQIIYDKMDIRDARGLILVKDGKLILDNLSMNLLNGEMRIKGEYNTQDMQSPFIDFSFDIKNFSIPATFETFNTVRKLAPVAKGMGGVISTSLSFRSGLGKDMMPVLSSISGFGNVRSSAVELISVETFDKITNALSLGKSASNTLKDLNVKFSIQDGKVMVDPFDMQLRSIRMVLGGEHSFDQTMNYALRMEVPRAEFGAGANELINQLTNSAAAKGLRIETGESVHVDVKIGGTLLNPSFSLNLAEAAGSSLQQVKEQVKTQIRDELEEKKEEIETQIREEVSERAIKLIEEAEKQAELIMDKANQAAQTIRNEANINAARIEKEAEGKNILAQRAAKSAADKIRRDAESAAEKVISEARRKADALIETAKKEAEIL